MTKPRTLQDFLTKLEKLRRDKVGEHSRPHKPAMLLATIDHVESGADNKIEFGPRLQESFRSYFDVVQTLDDRPTPHHPFFHLRSDGLFNHVPAKGMEQAVQNMRTAGGGKELARKIRHARLDDDLYALLQQPDARQKVREHIIQFYFPDHVHALLDVVQKEKDIADYEGDIRKDTRGEMDRSDSSAAPEKVRRPAFRRAVTENYDYRCAACGLRILLDSGKALVDAAHLVPWAESRNDSVSNGMALCPNHLWAMEHHLIAPGMDLRWHVARALDSQQDGHKNLFELKGAYILLPGDRRFGPGEEGLTWRMDHLAGAAQGVG